MVTPNYAMQRSLGLMVSAAEKRAENDKRVAKDVREYGCHIISVFDPEQTQPFFSYSIGIQETSGTPEAIVVGLKPKLGGFIINEYNRQVRAGMRFERGRLYSGFLEGFPVYIEPAKQKLLAEYTLGCMRYYQRKPYSVVQIIWPSTTGIWPWETGATQWFKSNQPMLGRARPDRP